MRLLSFGNIEDIRLQVEVQPLKRRLCPDVFTLHDPGKQGYADRESFQQLCRWRGGGGGVTTHHYDGNPVNEILTPF